MYGPFRVHPVLALFPEIDDYGFELLVGSVRESGIKLPILVDQEGRVILHGRARVRAHIAAGRDPNLIPRKMIPSYLRFEAIFDLIFARQVQTRRMLGSDMYEVSIAARPLYIAETVRRETRGTDRTYVAPGPRLRLVEAGDGSIPIQRDRRAG